MISKPGFLSVLLAGIAAYGVYKYSKMSDEQKRSLKERGKKILDDNLPQDFRSMFGSKKINTAEQTYE